jgi:hypothetical protein
MMKTTKTAIEMIREELCSRYGINEDQIKLELYISGVDKEKGMEILNDYSKYKGLRPFYNQKEHEDTQVQTVIFIGFMYQWGKR